MADPVEFHRSKGIVLWLIQLNFIEVKVLFYG